MRRIRLTVAYDGTDYCGWQVQNNVATIEGELNTALTRLTGQTVKVIGASRTDAGVHARGNVAVFDTESSIPPERFLYAVNALLPEDIVGGTQLARHSLRHQIEQGLIAVLQIHIYEAIIRGIMKHLPLGKLSVDHAFVVIGNYLRDDRMLNALGLQHYPAPFILPSGTPCHLRHQLESTLIGTKIRIVQHRIRIQNAYHAYVVEVQPFGNHLRTDKNIRLSLFKIGDDTLVGRACAGGIQIHTGNGRFGKQEFDVVLYLFRTETAVAQVRSFASGTDAGQLDATLRHH